MGNLCPGATQSKFDVGDVNPLSASDKDYFQQRKSETMRRDMSEIIPLGVKRMKKNHSESESLLTGGLDGKKKGMSI